MTEELKGATKRKNQKAEEYQNGKQAENVGDYGKAAAHYKKAADLKYAAAELALGKLYYFGQGVSQDYEAAYLYLQRAREKVRSKAKTAEALYYLGQMFRNGLGIEKSSMRAYNRLKLSARLGNNDAMYMLGEMFENGECDWNKSRRIREEYWYREAAFAGNVKAMQWLIKMYENGECGVRKDDAEAVYWSEQVKAAEKKYREDERRIFNAEVVEMK